MRIEISLFIAILIFTYCSNQKEKKDLQKDQITSITQKNMNNIQTYKENLKKTNTTNSNLEFFKAGCQTFKDKKCGVYVVEAGDNVWIIAEKYFKNYKHQNKYLVNETGTMAYEINLMNFSNLPGGVNDNLKVGDKVFIPID